MFKTTAFLVIFTSMLSAVDSNNILFHCEYYKSHVSDKDYMKCIVDGILKDSNENKKEIEKLKKEIKDIEREMKDMKIGIEDMKKEMEKLKKR
ncbi:MAG: hypothetical protein LBI78_03650 [Campylobacteraceae bacterium]|jgi:peptidoglycan hydrolase CwlO-like protein|nr:hypothetical protein [Campylobacteraceae bacterium]